MEKGGKGIVFPGYQRPQQTIMFSVRTKWSIKGDRGCLEYRGDQRVRVLSDLVNMPGAGWAL